MSPRISVIVPCYKANATLGACLAALGRSTHEAFEVIVVSDGCPQGPRTIAEPYGCRVVEQANAGPGAARNRGVLEASGRILFFLDADVLVPPGALTEIERLFAERPDVGALFGSYEEKTPAGNFVSEYKNLLHHYTHQNGREEAATFCGGFGAIRRELFDAVGGFDARHRFLEDIDLGYRLHRKGVRILLVKHLQFTHLKRYSLLSLVRSDVVGRAIPWTRLMLRNRIFRNDLNTRANNVWSVPCSVALAALLLASPAVWVFGFARIGLAVGAVLVGVWVGLNREFLRFLQARRGAMFALRGAMMLWLGYLYSAAGAAIGMLSHIIHAN